MSLLFKTKKRLTESLIKNNLVGQINIQTDFDQVEKYISSIEEKIDNTLKSNNMMEKTYKDVINVCVDLIGKNLNDYVKVVTKINPPNKNGIDGIPVIQLDVKHKDESEFDQKTFGSLIKKIENDTKPFGIVKVKTKIYKGKILEIQLFYDTTNAFDKNGKWIFDSL